MKALILSSILLISIFISCSTAHYQPKIGVCSAAAMDSLAKIQKTGILNFAPIDIARAVTDSFKNKLDFTEEEEGAFLKKVYNHFDKDIWCTQLKANVMELEIKSKQIKGWIAYSYDYTTEDSMNVLRDLNVLQADWQLDDDCAAEIIQQLNRILDPDLDVKELKPIMKIWMRPIFATAVYMDQHDKQTKIWVPIGYRLLYGPW